MTTTKILWKRSSTLEKANNYVGHEGELIVELETNRLFMYDGKGNIYASASQVDQNTYWSWGGVSAGYLIGSIATHSPGSPAPSASFPDTQYVQKHSFASDTNATSTGTLSHDGLVSTASAKNRGVAGYALGNSGPSSGLNYEGIIKMPFADETLTKVGHLDATSSKLDEGIGLSSPTKGYVIGGQPAAGYSTPGGTVYSNPTGIQSVVWSSDTASAVPGFTPLVTRHQGLSWSQRADAYWGGGRNYGSSTNLSDMSRFIFASQTNITLPASSFGPDAYGAVSFQSDSHGYKVGGRTPADSKLYQSQVDKFPFTSTVSMTDVGDLAISYFYNYGRGHGSGFSSTTHGYTTGGLFSSEPWQGPPAPGFHPYGQDGDFPVQPGTDYTNKFPFVNEVTSTNVGNLSSPSLAHINSSDSGVEV